MSAIRQTSSAYVHRYIRCASQWHLPATLLLAFLLAALPGTWGRAASTTNCLDGWMSTQAVTYNHFTHPNTPRFDCINLRPGGNNQMFWFDGDAEIDWRESPFAMWRTVTWNGADAQRVNATMLALTASFTPGASVNLTLENLILNNVDLDTGSVDLRLQGDELTWTLNNARFNSGISFYAPAPLTINVVSTNSEIRALTRQIASVTTLNIDPGAELRFFECGQLGTLNPDSRLSFNRVGSGVDVNGGTLLVDRSSVLFETGTNHVLLRNGGRLEMTGSGTRLDASRVSVENSTLDFGNNTSLHGDQITLRDAQIQLGSGAHLSDFSFEPISGTNVVHLESVLGLGGVSGVNLAMSGSNTVLRVNGSGLPFAEISDFKNDGGFELGQGTLIVGDDARYWISPAGTYQAQPEGRVIVEPGGELLIETSYILDMSAGLELELGGRMDVDGTLVGYGGISNGSPQSYLDFPGGTLQLATNATVFDIDVDVVDFDSDSELRMKLDPSGAETQRLDIQGELDLGGYPDLQLDLVNDTLLPAGTKVVLCDYETLEGGRFSGYGDEKIFQLGVNTWRIRYSDPYYSDTNQSVITLTAGANDPPIIGGGRDFSLFVNTTNYLPALARATDPDDDPLSLASATAATGTVTISGEYLVYTPPLDYVGTNTIDFCITDGTFTNCSTLTFTVEPYPPASPETCYATKMSAQAIALNNFSHVNDPPFNCVELTPAGQNTLFWFEDDGDIDWRDIYADYRMWQTAKWVAPAGVRTTASMVGYNESFLPILVANLTMENLHLENVDLDTGSIRLHLMGPEISWTLINARYTSDIALDAAAPLTIDVHGGASEIVGLNGRMDSRTLLSIPSGGSLRLFGCGSLSAIDPESSLYFYQSGSGADINGGQLILDQSWVTFNTGTNAFVLRNGGSLEMDGSGTRLDAQRVDILNADLDMKNNTILAGSDLYLDDARIEMASGAALSGFALRPVSGTSIIEILDHLGGIEHATLNMTGSDTILKIKGSDAAYAEAANIINEGTFDLGLGTLMIQDEASYFLRPGAVSSAQPQGTLVIEPGGELFVESGYHLQMGSGLSLTNNGQINIQGEMTVLGEIAGSSPSADMEVSGGTLSLATNASTFTVASGTLEFDAGSQLNMKLDPSGAESQQVIVNNRLDLRGYPTLQLSLVNDVLLPAGSKIVLCDYDILEGGEFHSMTNNHVFTQGLNTWRIRYRDPYYSESSVITLTAGANDPPTPGGHPIYHLFANTTNSLPALAGATDPDGDALSIASASSPDGVVSIDGPNLTYAPSLDFEGTNVISYCITDGTFTNCATITNVVTAYDPMTAATCFSSPMAIYAPNMSNGNHPNTPPYNCLELFPAGNNTAFWFDTDADIDWRDIYGSYRMWQSVKWVAPAGPRVSAQLAGYDGDISNAVPFNLIVQNLTLENVDLDTGSIGLALRGYDTTWDLINGRLTIGAQPITFDSTAPLTLRVTGGESEIVGLAGAVDAVTALTVASGSALLLTDCGYDAGPDPVDFYRAGSTVDLDGGELRLTRSQLAFNTGTNGFTVRSGATLVLQGPGSMLDTAYLSVDASQVVLGGDAWINAGAVSLTAGSTLQLTAPTSDVVLTNGAKRVLVDYGALAGTFDNVADGAILRLGLNVYRLLYSDPDYGDGTAITLTVVEPPRISSLVISPTGLTIEVSGPPLAVVELITSTDLLMPLDQWPAVQTNALNVAGILDLDWVDPLIEPRRFFSVRAY